MSITFTCDGDGCGVTAKPGTVTGGLPPGFAPDYVYEETGGGSKRCVRIDHYCETCTRKRREERDAAFEARVRARLGESPPAPVPEPPAPAPKKAPKKAAPKKAPKEKPKPKPRRKATPKKEKPADPEQGGLFD